MTDPEMQQTLAGEGCLEGVGFLGGKPVRVTFRPVETDSGIVFVRTDMPRPVRIPADVRFVQSTPRRTTLAVGGVAVEMVEHVLAALAGLGIDNCEIHLDAAELPGGDGSAQHFVECLLEAGIVAQDRPRRVLVIDQPVHVGDASTAVTAVPCGAGGPLFSFHLDYGIDAPIPQQSRLFQLDRARFCSELAPARTFLLEHEAEQLRAQGLGATVTAKDLLIYGPGGPIDNEPRFPDEPVRHKLLDMVGDLSLVGCRILAHLSGYRSGHRLNARMVQRLLEIYGDVGAGRRRSVTVPSNLASSQPASFCVPARASTKATPLRVGVVGIGHMGKHHARVLASLPDVELVGVADVSAEQVETVARHWGVPGHVDFRKLIPHVDAATIAVPTVAHAAVAREFLTCGVPVMIEKPLCATLAEADELIELSRRHGALIQVGHSERFNPAFVAAAPHLGRPKYIQADRLGPYSHRSTDIGVVLDLMVHDLELILALCASQLQRVDALGVSVFGKHEDVANARLVFEDGCVATLNASRASPAPRRRLQIWSTQGYADLDLARRHVRLLRCPGHPAAERAPRHSGPTAATLAADWAPLPETAQWPLALEERRMDPASCEPLVEQLRQFVRCVRRGENPWVDAQQGRNALELAERVLTCIERHRWDGESRGPTGPHLHDGSVIPAPHFHLQPARSRQEQRR